MYHKQCMLRGIIAKSRINLSTMLQNGASMCMDSSSMIRIKSIDTGGVMSPETSKRGGCGVVRLQNRVKYFISAEEKLKA